MGRWDAEKRRDEERRNPKPRETRSRYVRGPGSRASTKSQRESVASSRGKSSLAALGRYDDIPAALYPDGVRTGVGGGNAGPAQSIDRNGDAYIPPTPTVKTRETAPPNPGLDRNAKGTQMGSSGALADFDAFADRLTSEYGVDFHFDSDQLPTTERHKSLSGGFVDADYELPDYVDWNGETELRSALFGKDGKGGYVGTALYGDLADKVDLSRAIDFEVDTASTPKYWGMEEKIENPPKGTKAEPTEKKEGGPSGINWADGKAGQKVQRNRAFLDYKGPGGTMMALRAQEAAQGTIRQNGNTYGKNAEGKWTRLSPEAAKELMRDRSMHASSTYVTDNAYTSKPAEEHAQETLSKHVGKNKVKLSHGEQLDLTKDAPDLGYGESIKPKTAGLSASASMYEPDEDIMKWYQ